MAEPPSRDSKIGKSLRFLASGGMAEEDPDVVRELLTAARHLAELILADASSSPALQNAARDLLERLDSDTYG